MNRSTKLRLVFSCIGKRNYIADYFREELGEACFIIGTSNTPWTPGFCSCDHIEILPPISDEHYIASLLRLCREQKAEALLSFFDLDVFILSQHRDAFLKIGTVPVLPPHHAAKIAFDKYETFLFCQEHHIPTPYTTCSLDGAVAALAAGSLKFPLVVKPRRGYASINTFTARSLSELETFFHCDDEMIIQQFIEGEAWNADTLGNLRGEPVAAVTWRKLLSRHGETERAMTAANPELAQSAAEISGLLGIVGPCDVDFIKSQDGCYYLIELNPRFGGGYPVSHLAGANFPAKIVQMVRGEEVKNDGFIQKNGVTMMKRLQIIPGPEVS